MRLMQIIFLIFLIFALCEVYVFMKLGASLGFGWTLLAVIATGFIGLHCIRQQGLLNLKLMQAKLERQELPAKEMISGVLLIFAGVLLLTPGFLTDILGIALLFSSLRDAFIRLLISGIGAKFGSDMQTTIIQGTINPHQTTSTDNTGSPDRNFSGFSQEKDPLRSPANDSSANDSSVNRSPGNNIIEGEFKRIDETDD